MVIGRTTWGSVFRAIVHGLMSRVYVIYFRDIDKKGPAQLSGTLCYASSASRWYPRRRTASMRTLDPMLASFLRRKPT